MEKWYDADGIALHPDSLAVFNAMLGNAVTPIGKRKTRRSFSEEPVAAEYMGSGSPIINLSQLPNVESKTILRALQQKGVDEITVQVCVCVSKSGLSAEVIRQLRFPEQFPFLKDVLGPHAVQV